MGNSFDRLITVQFQQKLKPAALRIYQQLFPGCELKDLRENGVKVHVLDQEFGIDAMLVLASKQWISIQEKYRQNYYLKFKDFTQEYYNAVGMEHESPGEWFKLGAQLYFYGWANQENTGFEKWFILDVLKYKCLVEEQGGLENIGELHYNEVHGRASFYSIPIAALIPAILFMDDSFYA